ncbi:hypothetical protein T459_07350 [Capsicum annuum]|uniref:Cytochrome P450 83B1-like n=1 Tax=Capsicum annuum TaxID=4072 RepID=A0A2G2ZTE1_CAPAN|nr:hypothetical protein T459_07350 [Capsicum annuum]
MMYFSLFVDLLTIIILSFLLARKNRKNNTPPGPVGLPLIGNLHQYDSFAPHLYFWKISQKYGKIFSLKLGSSNMVVVSSAKLAKEILKTQDLAFCSRASILGLQKLSYNGQDVVFSPYNDYWRELRKICVLHVLSLKKVQSFSPIREDEVSRMIKKISQQAATSQITNLSSIMTSLTTTTICRVAFGIRYDEETQDRRKFAELLKVTEEMLGGFFISDYFPLLGWIDKLSGKINKLEKNFKDLDEFYEGLIEQHLNPNRPKSMEGDIVDLLLQLKKEKSIPIDLTLDNIKAIIMNYSIFCLFYMLASSIWAMTTLMENPNAMKKVQTEIRESVGKKSIVNEDDIQNLQYFKAVVKETFRLYPPGRLLIARQSMENTILEGYEIKPKTIIHVNVWQIGRDPEIWKIQTNLYPRDS